jgi:hypothetical protein
LKEVLKTDDLIEGRFCIGMKLLIKAELDNKKDKNKILIFIIIYLSRFFLYNIHHTFYYT